MASVRIHAPGTTFGPCAGSCGHADCQKDKRMAKALCSDCGKEIGFESEFYISSHNLTHANCTEDTFR